MKVLLTFVGKQDPFSDKTEKEGAIATIVRKYRPDIVVMLPSADMPGCSDSTEANARYTEDWIHDEIDKNIKVYIRPLNLTDPTDYQQVMLKSEKEIKEILDSLSSEDVNYYLNTSSGTPEMKNMWLIWANSGLIPRAIVLQVADPRYVEENNRIRELNIDFIEEVNCKNRAARYVEQGLFGIAAEELSFLARLTFNSTRIEKALMLRDIYRAWQCWDLINYREAYDRLKKVYNKYCNSIDMQNVLTVIKEQVNCLRNLASEASTENVYNMVDLFYNMKRRFERQDYTDTLARFWRIYEGSMYYVLRTYYGTEPNELDKSQNKENLLRIRNRFSLQGKMSYSSAHDALRNIFNDKRLNSVLHQSVLIEKGGSQQTKSVEEALEDLRQFRNESIVAHGMKPVARHYADAAVKVAPIILGCFFKDKINGLLESYPFGENSVAVIAQFTRTI